jgi:hypothetical protein
VNHEEAYSLGGEYEINTNSAESLAWTGSGYSVALYFLSESDQIGAGDMVVASDLAASHPREEGPDLIFPEDLEASEM